MNNLCAVFAQKEPDGGGFPTQEEADLSERGYASAECLPGDLGPRWGEVPRPTRRANRTNIDAVVSADLLRDPFERKWRFPMDLFSIVLG